MENMKPIMTITPEITALSGQIEAMLKQPNVVSNQHITSEKRVENRLRMIHSSLALDGNALTLEQVLDIVAGRRVEASEKDILEVENAIVAYNKLFDCNPYREKDLLEQHSKMMRGLIRNAGKYRDSNVVASTRGWFELIQSPSQVYSQIAKGILTHYQLMFLHPFSEGNGLVARMWQTLFMYHESAIFAWLPVDSYVYAHQQEYKNLLMQHNAEQGYKDASDFVRFMLVAIKQALIEIGGKVEESAYVNDDVNRYANTYAGEEKKEPEQTGLFEFHSAEKSSTNAYVNDDVNRYANTSAKKEPELSRSEKKIVSLIASNPGITQVEIAKKMKMHKITAYRNFKRLRELGVLSRDGSDKTGTWIVVNRH